jgi:hypothetical protein
MRFSSAKQLEFSQLFGATGSQADVANPDSSIPNASTGAASFPDFGGYDPAFAANSKLAGRINAANISDNELREFLRERKRLLTKKLEGKITRRESNRLEYVRWTLDRIEDARDGHVLEMLENSVAQYEHLAEDLNGLLARLEESLPSKKD